ncbi:hypothetical protein J7384_17270 [Endozoicomonas sp. G2_1]|uniref:hypothetical protein n=1 Tax=Endozoicomonas sp. G2_1 TaxID=2821091 RepID=UPI001ADCC0D0|nr:hypothetical protein [Endozoicomonas sp. G2_1]MBO9492116.1 hypothetical protein [Endozoicomonas sp. G2_1]
MAINKKNQVYLSVSTGNGKFNRKDGFQATFIDAEGQPQYKSMTFDEGEHELPYQVVDAWAQSKVDEFGAKYVRPTLEELLVRLEKARSKSRPSTMAGRLPVDEAEESRKMLLAMSNYNFLDVEIKRAYRVLGEDRVYDVLSRAKALVDNLVEKEQEKREAASAEATKKAQPLFEAYKSTGICLSDSIKDKYVLEIYNELKAQHNSK